MFQCGSVAALIAQVNIHAGDQCGESFQIVFLRCSYERILRCNERHRSAQLNCFALNFDRFLDRRNAQCLINSRLAGWLRIDSDVFLAAKPGASIRSL